MFPLLRSISFSLSELSYCNRVRRDWGGSECYLLCGNSNKKGTKRKEKRKDVTVRKKKKQRKINDREERKKGGEECDCAPVVALFITYDRFAVR